MAQEKQCRAVKRDGVRCAHNAKFGGFCGVHLPKQSGQKEPVHLSKIAWRALEAAATLAGAVELIKLVVETWRSLPFGPGPQMPREYRDLADEFVPSLPRERTKKMRVFNKGPDSIDWRRAKKIYDAAQYVRARLESGASSAESLTNEIADIDSSLNILFETMQEPLREMICERLGEGVER